MTEQRFVTVMLLGLGITVCFLIIKIITNHIVKTSFSKRYNIGLMPKSVKVRKKKRKKGENYYYLNYPYWLASKKDGTADRRVRRNNIIWQRSNLFVDDYLIFSKKPYDLIEVVKRLRLQGIEIALCAEEQEKYGRLVEMKEAFAYNTSIQRIVEYYMARPADFEILCADLFNRMGYDTELTPPANDGGYDIILYRQKERTIVECKCYSIGHKVGRPSIQKLVGANNIVLADHMLFITTSDFAAGAVRYAEEVGVELINGHILMDLLNHYGFIEKEGTYMDIMEWQLEVVDLSPYVPSDIYAMFFQ